MAFDGHDGRNRGEHDANDEKGRVGHVKESSMGISRIAESHETYGTVGQVVGYYSTSTEGLCFLRSKLLTME